MILQPWVYKAEGGAWQKPGLGESERRRGQLWEEEKYNDAPPTFASGSVAFGIRGRERTRLVMVDLPPRDTRANYFEKCSADLER